MHKVYWHPTSLYMGDYYWKKNNAFWESYRYDNQSGDCDQVQSLFEFDQHLTNLMTSIGTFENVLLKWT